MPTKKIADLPAHMRCLSPDHNPPSMMVYQPGTYEHTCSACGYVVFFTVSGVTCQVPDGSRGYEIQEPPTFSCDIFKNHDMHASLNRWG